MTPKSCNPSQKRACIYAPEIIELSSAFSVFAVTFNASCSKCRSKPHFLISQSAHICYVTPSTNNAIKLMMFRWGFVHVTKMRNINKKNSVWCVKKNSARHSYEQEIAFNNNFSLCPPKKNHLARNMPSSRVAPFVGTKSRERRICWKAINHRAARARSF